MNSCKVKGIILAVIISLASIMMPFSVYADNITNSNVNINYYLDSVTETTSGTYMQTYKVVFVFDQSYLGWISTKMVGTYKTDNNVPSTTLQFTRTEAIYVNGVTTETSFTIVTSNTQNGGAIQSLSQSIQNSNVTPLADLSTLDDILNVLTDINNNIEIDVIQELQNIVSNTELANDYLEMISKLRQYNIPLESITFVSSLLARYPDNVSFFYGDNNLSIQYPIFDLPNNSYISVRGDTNATSYTLIFGCSLNMTNKNQFISNLVYNNSISANDITEYELYQYSYIYGLAGNISIYKVKFNRSSNPVIRNMSGSNIYFMPIYFNKNDNTSISTEFALTWGLSNSLLDNIETIANGTSQSNSAASDLESEASEYSEIADDVIGVEEGLTSNFETSVNQIDLNTGLNGFGGNFMTSATWVRTQFDRLTENTPYGSLVVYGLTLGFVLLMLGKVLL